MRKNTQKTTKSTKNAPKTAKRTSSTNKSNKAVKVATKSNDKVAFSRKATKTNINSKTTPNNKRRVKKVILYYDI